MSKIKQIISSFVGLFAVIGFLYFIGFVGKFTDSIAEFFTWYFTYKYCDSGLNNFFSLIIKIVVWIVPLLVANLFTFSNKKDEKKVSNFIATLVGMVLSVIFKFIQDYLWWIVGVLFFAIVAIITLKIFCKKKEQKLSSDIKTNEIKGEINDSL